MITNRELFRAILQTSGRSEKDVEKGLELYMSIMGEWGEWEAQNGELIMEDLKGPKGREVAREVLRQMLVVLIGSLSPEAKLEYFTKMMERSYD